MQKELAICKIAVERAKALPPVEGDADLHRQKLIARALFAQGMVGMGVGNMPFVLQVLKEAIAISRVTGDKQMLGYSLEMYYTATGFINAPIEMKPHGKGFTFSAMRSRQLWVGHGIYEDGKTCRRNRAMKVKRKSILENSGK